jgi:hypothetical protein
MTWKVTTGKDGVSHHFVGNKSPDTHHGGTSVVQFDGTLFQLGGIIKLVPAKVKGTVTVVTDEFGFVVQPGSITVDNFGNSEESKHLDKDILAISGVQKCLPRGHTVRDTFGTREADSSSGGQVSDNSQHRNTSVLDLAFAKSIELFLVSIGDKLQRIPQSQLFIEEEQHAS